MADATLVAQVQRLEAQVREMQDELSAWRARGLDLLALDTLTSHRFISPTNVTYWLTRQAGGNAQFQTTRPDSTTWSEA